MSTPQKRQIAVDVGRISPADFDTSVSSIIDMLQDLHRKHGTDIRLDYGQHDEYDDSSYYKVLVYRTETDEEFAARIRAGIEAQEHNKAQRLKHLQDQAAELGFDLMPKT